MFSIWIAAITEKWLTGKWKPPLSDRLVYILFSASSPSFLSGKPCLQEKLHSLAYLKWVAYFHHHTSAQRQLKSPKLISGNFWHIVTLFCLYPHIHTQNSLRKQALNCAANSKHRVHHHSASRWLPAASELEQHQPGTSKWVAPEW